ncbi:PREDICTED: uncharacterized protein LOC107352481 isoform X1 [Acropora digitifera]|uniref:uncharacterized protein LOC107352481 isoform X1 n=1 Tax=Acropora digitifera TaxID=70779 RepID=UPI00077A9070|nr:PREDICTED: uncharacterized protein LOC107352481 isoform X1 [Acropora digitifera]
MVTDKSDSTIETCSIGVLWIGLLCMNLVSPANGDDYLIDKESDGLILDLTVIFFALCILFLLVIVALAVVIYRKANTWLVTKVPTNLSPGSLSGSNRGRGLPVKSLPNVEPLISVPFMLVLTLYRALRISFTCRDAPLRMQMEPRFLNFLSETIIPVNTPRKFFCMI